MKNTMCISDFFEKKLGAPLRCKRRSWGSARPTGEVVLRVWKDEIKRIDGKQCALVLNKEFVSDDRFGNSERVDHLSMIDKGALAVCVICTSSESRPRKITHYNDRDLWQATELKHVNGSIYLLLENKVTLY